MNYCVSIDDVVISKMWGRGYIVGITDSTCDVKYVDSYSVYTLEDLIIAKANPSDGMKVHWEIRHELEEDMLFPTEENIDPAMIEYAINCDKNEGYCTGSDCKECDYYNKHLGSAFDDFQNAVEQCQDMINTPSHYTAFPMEVADMCQLLIEKMAEYGYFESHYQAACFKSCFEYRMRAGYKDPDKIEEDIKKAMKWEKRMRGEDWNE